MRENKLKIHADSGEIFEKDRETGENFYESLRFQLDKTKKTIQTVLRYSGSVEGFKDYISKMIDTDRFVAPYNSSIGLVPPIHLNHTRAHKDDEMLKTMNMNNWHEFLDSSIRLAPSMSDYESDIKWFPNIGRKLKSTFRK